MSVSYLTSRRATVGQSASFTFRRLYSPIACAGNNRPELLQRPIAPRPVLRESPKPKNTLVAKRGDPPAQELETPQETAPIIEELIEPEGDFVAESSLPTRLPEKIFHFGGQSKEVPPPEEIEAVPREMDSKSSPGEKAVQVKPEVLVAKRPSVLQRSEKPALERPVRKGGDVETRGGMAKPNVIVARRDGVRRSTLTAPVEKKIEEKPNVIVAKRPTAGAEGVTSTAILGEKSSVVVGKRPVARPQAAASTTAPEKRSSVITAKRPAARSEATTSAVAPGEKPNVIVAKRPAARHDPLTSMATPEEKPNVIGADRPLARPETVTSTAAPEEKPNVIVTKRPVAKRESSKQVAAAPAEAVVERVDDVLVVKKSTPRPAAPPQIPQQQSSNANSSGSKLKPLHPTSEGTQQSHSLETGAPKGSATGSEPGRVIERPRPKAVPKQPLSQPPVVHLQRPTLPPRQEEPQVLDVIRARQTLRAQVRAPPTQPQETIPDSEAPITKDTVSEELPEKETSDPEPVPMDPLLDTEKAMQIRASLLESAHLLHVTETPVTKETIPETTPEPAVSEEPPLEPLDASSMPKPEIASQNHTPAHTVDDTVHGAVAQPRSVTTDGLARPRAPAPPDKTPSLMKRPAMASASVKNQELDLDRQFLKEKEQKAIEEKKRILQEKKELKEQSEAQRQEKRQFQRRKKSDPMLIESRRKARQERQSRRKDATEQAEREMIIEVGAEGLSVEELADLLVIDPTEIMKILFVKGVMVTVNQTLDMDSVKVIAAELDVEVLNKTEEAVTEMAKKEASFCEDDDAEAINRPPVVTVMGHVDHGKTSLLDYIRKTQVVDGEEGGITQAIGAYTCSVEVEGVDRMICFLDTPGHEAFGAMRARGTRVTDIAIIVIAANDGIRPQTTEAISHARAAEVPIVVAINKIDVDGADPERVKRELSEIELLPEEWGGQTPVVSISAKKGTGVQELLEMVTLVADVQLNLRANPETPAKGTVIEAYVDKRSGVLATVLVQNGTLHVGDAIVAGGAFGKVRSLTNEIGSPVDIAGPSIAVQVLGFHEIPAAGDIFSVCADEAEAKEEAEKVASEIRLRRLSETAGGGSMVTLSSLASVDEEDGNALQRLNLVLKGDTSGSIEAVKGALAKLPQDAVMIRYLHIGAGDVTESDIILAATAHGMIISFNAPISESVRSIAKQRSVELQSYSVIYDLIDDVRGVMEGRLSPVEDRLPIGQAEVRAVFGAGSRTVAGCMVTEGRLDKNCFIRVLRKKACVFEGDLTSLRRVKDDVTEVASGLECGVGCNGYSEWQEGDRIEAFTLVQKRMTLEESHATMAVDETELQEIIG